MGNRRPAECPDNVPRTATGPGSGVIPGALSDISGTAVERLLWVGIEVATRADGVLTGIVTGPRGAGVVGPDGPVAAGEGKACVGVKGTAVDVGGIGVWLRWGVSVRVLNAGVDVGSGVSVGVGDAGTGVVGTGVRVGRGVRAGVFVGETGVGVGQGVLVGTGEGVAVGQGVLVGS